MTEICQYLRNWFDKTRCFGDFRIQNGNIMLDYDTGNEFSNIPLVPGQYFRIVGSVFNDGVYKYPASTLHDENFSGAVWTMAIPRTVIEIAAEIDAWNARYNTPDSAVLSPYSSESFGGYAYSKAGNASADGSDAITWKTVFGARLAPWRKI